MLGGLSPVRFAPCWTPVFPAEHSPEMSLLVLGAPEPLLHPRKPQGEFEQRRLEDYLYPGIFLEFSEQRLIFASADGLSPAIRSAWAYDTRTVATLV